MNVSRITDLFLSPYESYDYLSKTRARLLFYFMSSFILFTFLLQFSMLFAGWYDFLVTIPMTTILVIGLTAGLIILRTGRYGIASKIFIVFGAVTIVAGLIRQPFLEVELSYTSYIYFVYPVIALCAIFTTQRFLTVIALVMAATDIALFIITRNLVGPESMKMITIAFNNSLFAIVFLYIISLLIMKVFERSVELSTSESEKNYQANQFIKQVLMENLKKVVEAMNTMAVQSDSFSESAHDQAASIEEITATIEKVSSGIDSVSDTAASQSQSLDKLVSVLDELSEVIRNIDASIAESLTSTEDITVRARSGEDYLRNMAEGIQNIKKSSVEMTDIISIINDISDQINLLSLNAAIEAARAGDAGRGFAVVADEISKLADGTASSIKSIESLIQGNESEIEKGLSGVDQAVEVLTTVIREIEDISGKIRGMAEYKEKQIDTNRLVNEHAGSIRKRAEDISGAADEQRNAISEIVKNITVMNESSQNNSAHAVKMAYDSQNLVDLVNELKKQIEEYRG